MRVSQKFLTYVVVGALVAALFISCKSNAEPENAREMPGENPPAGEYTDFSGKVTVSADGKISGTLVSLNTTFEVKVNNWYKYSNDDNYNYVKEGSYVVNSITPNNYTFTSISWRYYNGKPLLYFEIDKVGATTLTKN